MRVNFEIKSAFISGFENRCFRLMVSAYQQSILEKSIELNWNENDITSQLNEYIESNPNRLNWSITSNLEHIIPLHKKKLKGFSARSSRIDLRFATIKSKQEFIYFFEAKNLKESDSSLKRRYITTGIDNYISGKYHNGCLLGYLLAGKINKTVSGINSLLRKDKRNLECLTKENSLIHDQYYESKHSGLGVLKHLIFNFANDK